MGQISLRWIMVVVSIIEVVVACVVVWYIGYQSTQSTVNGLSRQLRRTTLDYATAEISTVLSRPILAAYTLQGLLVARGYDFTTLDTVENTTLIQDISSILRGFRGLSQVGILTKSNVAVAVAEAVLGANATANQTGQQMIYCMYDYIIKIYIHITYISNHATYIFYNILIMLCSVLYY